MKNKYIIFILMAALTIGSFTGCQTRSNQQSAQESTSSKVSENDPAENAGSSSESSDDSSAADGSSTKISDTGSDDTANGDDLSKDKPQDPSDTDFSMEEQTLLEHEGVTVKAISWDSDTSSLKVQAQNTSDQDYIIQFSNTSINNYMMEPIFSLNVNANSQAEKNAEFNPSDLSDCGIKNVAQIQMKVNLLDAISFDTLYSSDYATVQTAASMEEQSDNESGEVLYNQDGLKLISRGFIDDPDWGKLWKVYISNDTDDDLVFYTPTITLNGNTLDVLFSVTVPAGKRAVGVMTIFQEDLDTYQIADIISASLTLQLQNPETFETLRTIENISLDISNR